MTRFYSLETNFVDYIPAILNEGEIYVSVNCAIVAHKCCCGCGNEVITPLDPAHWIMSFDGDTVSLSPSIGNWSLDCQSHYWIRRNQVQWARQFSEHEIKAGRALERLKNCRNFDDKVIYLTKFLLHWLLSKFRR